MEGQSPTPHKNGHSGHDHHDTLGHDGKGDTHHHHGAPESGQSPHHHAAGDEHSAHDRHAGHNVAQFRDKFWIALLLTIPTLIWGHMLQRGFGYTAPQFPGVQWIAPICGTAVFLYGGWVFIQGAFREIRDRVPGMMLLIGLAITVAFVFSLAVTLGYPGMPLWDELATLVTVMLLGHWMEMRSIAQAHGAVDELAKLLPATATRIVIQNGEAERFEEVPLGDLVEGDLVLVRPGASLPADGLIREGRGPINESMITGESRPVEKGVGASVIAGTVNGTGALRVEVTGVGEHTALSGIMRLVRQAQASRSRAQSLADRAAFALTIVAVVVGVATWVTWLAIGAGGAYAIERMVSVLVIACPHALGLAIPLVIAISTTLAAQRGLLIRDRRGFEEAWRLTTVVFDKTGTLTLGEFRVVAITPNDNVSDDEALRLAASVERASEHTIARSIVQTAEDRNLVLSPVSDVVAIPGHGIRATVDGRRFLIGGPALLREQQVTFDAWANAAVDRASQEGQTAVTLLEEHSEMTGTAPKVLAVFAIADAVRPESYDAVRSLHEAGISVVMMTGDAKPVADAVARDLGIDVVFAEVLPAEKAKTIASLQKPRNGGRAPRVAMVGDGVNDAPALVTADVGIAIGAGTDVAVEAGDVVLVRNDPRDVPALIQLSGKSYRKMVQNLWWATGYNIVAIPLAAGVLAPWGIVLPPAAAAVLMSLSTVIVAANAQLLRRAGN